LRYFGVARTNHFRVAKNIDFETSGITFLNAFDQGIESVLSGRPDKYSRAVVGQSIEAWNGLSKFERTFESCSS
jgi:hypothetical protein